MSQGIVLRRENAEIRAGAKRHGLAVMVTDEFVVPFERTLVVSPGVRAPWELVEVGLHFLEAWDAAAPLWRYGVLAGDVGTPTDRRLTEQVVRDLRVPLYAHELLFVRQSEAGLRLMEVWGEEVCRQDEHDSQDGDGMRLAFVRALYRVKPRFCALPRQGWLMEEAVVAETPRAARRQRAQDGLVRVEVAPGRWARCRPGEEDELRRRLGWQQLCRRERKGSG